MPSKKALKLEGPEEALIPDILRLRCTAGPCVGKTFFKPGKTLTVGRTTASKICVQDPSVSEKHAKAEWTGSLWQLRDVGSSNGTKVNGKALESEGDPVELKDGDEILFGEDSVVCAEIMAATSENISVQDYMQAECLRIEQRLQARLEQAASMLKEKWKIERQMMLASP